MKTLPELQKEFGARLVPLYIANTYGLRNGIRTTCKEVAGSDPILDFIASDDTIDRYNEKINQSGWELDNFLANPVVPDCHDYSSIAKVLAQDILTKAEQVQDGKLHTRALFCVDNPLGLLGYKMAKGKFIRSQSVGFIPLEWVNGNASDQPDRTYNKCELLEKSLVVVPANPGATVGLALKSGCIQRSDVRATIKFLEQFCGEEKQTPDDPAGASVAGVNDAHWLRMARSLNSVLNK